MGSLFRSRDMAYCEIFLQAESAFNCVAALGELGVVQFNDTNALTPPHTHPHRHHRLPKFLPEIRRCDEMQRKIRFIERQMSEEGIKSENYSENPRALQPRDITKLEAKLDELETKLIEMDNEVGSTKYCQLEMLKRLIALELTAPYLSDINLTQFHTTFKDGSASKQRHRHESMESGSFAKLNFLVGMIARERCSSFERMIWRMAGNNVYVRSLVVNSDLHDPKPDANMSWNVFIAIFEGEILREKIETICEAFHANVYSFPDCPEERSELCDNIRPRVDELTTVLKEATRLRHQLLASVAGDIGRWAVQLCKVKCVYHMMNMLNLDVTKRYFIGHCWCPVEELKRIEDALSEATRPNSGELLVPFIVNRILPTASDQVPTYVPTNKFTTAFQAIVDAFSIAGYHEINPTLFTIITFPFLFSIMFSDAGHGAILLAIALWLILKETPLTKLAKQYESFSIIFSGRYILLLMAIFSIYSGFMFNEFFGHSVNLFQSRWHSNFSDSELASQRELIQLSPGNSDHLDGHPYPIGLDPIWYMASNRIVFTNSLKMKLSVIFGVTHMFFGVVLSLGNHLYFRRYSSIVCEFFPQVLLISAMFVYMDSLIVYKWVAFSAANDQQAPSILLSMINMFLLQYPDATEADQFINENLKTIQYVLVAICIVCVPWLLLAKPLYLLSTSSKRSISCNVGGCSLSPAVFRSPMPVLSRPGNKRSVSSPALRNHQDPFTADTFELTDVVPSVQVLNEVDERQSLSVASAMKSIRSPAMMKFANIFGGDDPSPRSPSLKQLSTTSCNNNGGLKASASNDTIVPVASEAGSGIATPNGKSPTARMDPVSVAYSPFPSSNNYGDLLNDTAASKEEVTGQNGEFDFGEVLMLQIILTIEYILGLISHTASYLRLWALSLAHAELSEVLWKMILRPVFMLSAKHFPSLGFLYITLGFLPWTCLTFAVLIVMETLSAFLHALRLHWVEFQSKFYHGDGHLFEPFSFKRCLQNN